LYTKAALQGLWKSAAALKRLAQTGNKKARQGLALVVELDPPGNVHLSESRYSLRASI